MLTLCPGIELAVLTPRPAEGVLRCSPHRTQLGHLKPSTPALRASTNCPTETPTPDLSPVLACVAEQRARGASWSVPTLQLFCRQA